MTNETLRMQMLAGVITEGQYKAKLLNELQYFHNGAEMNQIINYDDSDITDDLEFLGQGSMDGQDFTPGSTYDIGGQEYKIESQGDEFKLVLAEALNESLNESMIGGIVGIGAINQIPPRAKADYETAFEHFLGGKYGLNEVEVEEVKIEEGAFGDLLSRMENNTKMAADILTVITLAKEDKEGNAEKAVELLMKNHDLSEEAALEAVTRIFKKAFEWVDSMEEGKKVKIEEGRNDWWVKADEELGLDFDGENLEDLAMNADESWQADFAQQVLDIDASDYEDYKNQVSAIYDETNPF